jgi:hypothetical protein
LIEGLGIVEKAIASIFNVKNVDRHLFCILIEGLRMGERAIASIFNVKNIDRWLFWRLIKGLGVGEGAIASTLNLKTGWSSQGFSGEITSSSRWLG